MALANKLGGLLQKATSSYPPLYQQTIRCMSSSKPFVDAFLFRIKKNRESLNGRKIWSRRSFIYPEFVDSSVLIYNGKNFVRCKITEGKVGHKFGEFALTRRKPANKAKAGGKGVKGKTKK